MLTKKNVLTFFLQQTTLLPADIEQKSFKRRAAFQLTGVGVSVQFAGTALTAHLAAQPSRPSQSRHFIDAHTLPNARRILRSLQRRIKTNTPACSFTLLRRLAHEHISPGFTLQMGPRNIPEYDAHTRPALSALGLTLPALVLGDFLVPFRISRLCSV